MPTPTLPPAPAPVSAPASAPEPARGQPSREHVDVASEAGSLVTEYGLLAVLGATIVGVAIKWASGGAIFELLGALMRKVRILVGA